MPEKECSKAKFLLKFDCSFISSNNVIIVTGKKPHTQIYKTYIVLDI